MANNIEWQRQVFNPVSVNPTLGFASAAKTFGNINKQLTDKEAAESLAALNAEKLDMAKQQLDFTLGAPQRAITEEERLLAKSAEQGLFAQQAAEDALDITSQPKQDALFTNIRASEDPRVQELTGLAPGQSGPMLQTGFEKFDEFADANAASFTDPKSYKKELLTGLLKSGQFEREEANTIANAKTAEQFPTMSTDMQKALFTAVGKGRGSGSGTGAGASGSGTFKPWSSMPTVLQENDIHKNFMDTYPIDKSEDGFFEFDYTGPGGKVDVNQGDIRFLSNEMKKEGVNPAATYGVLETYIVGNNLDFDPRNMTQPQKDRFKADAQQIMAQQADGYNSKTGATVQAGQAKSQSDYYGQLDKILARGTTQSMSDDDLAAQFLGTLGPAETPAQLPPATVPAPQSAGIMPGVGNNNVVPQAAPATPAPAGIMPSAQPQDPTIPAIMGNAVKSGLEVNAEGVKILKWLSDQTGQGAIDLVKSFKNAPEWLAEFQKGYQQ